MSIREFSTYKMISIGQSHTYNAKIEFKVHNILIISAQRADIELHTK